ncbi:MAG TPA: hypothetical protein VIO60_10735, partial [Rectinemataceae bacterium]
IELELARPMDFASEDILIGLDTYDRDLGQFAWPHGGRVPSGLEFLLRISDADTAELLVIPSYNQYASRFASSRREDGKFERLSLLVNGAVITQDNRFIPEKRFDASALRKGKFDEAGNLWNVADGKIRLRLPWTLINVSDPSSLQVLHDTRTGYYNPERDGLSTRKTDGVLAYATVWNQATAKSAGSARSDPASAYVWKGWEEAPPYRERYKKSYFILKEAWKAEAEADEIFR